MSKKSKGVQKNSQRDNKGYITVEHPKNEFSLEQRQAALKYWSDKASKEYPENLAKLERLILASQPVITLSTLSKTFLAQPAGVDPEWDEDEPVLQHHIELVQSLILKHDYSKFEPEFPDVRQIASLSKIVCDQFSMRRGTSFDPESSDTQRSRKAFEESVKINTQAVRNWGYPQFIQQILLALWSPLDAPFEQEIGIKPTRVIEMFLRLMEESEEKLDRHRRAEHAIWTATSHAVSIEEFKKIFQEDEDFEQLVASGFPLKRLKIHLLMRSSTELCSVHSFSRKELAELYGEAVSEEALWRVFKAWSMQFGDLAKTKIDDLFMAGPIKGQPFIQLDDETLYLPIANLLLSYADTLLERLFIDRPKLKSAYDKRRGPFLEEDLEKILAKAFPSAEVQRGSYFKVGSVQYESDILILIDDYAIILEAKAGRVSDAAKRAGISLKEAVEDLVIAPAEQAARFQRYLEENQGVLRFATKRRNVINTVDTTKIKHFIRLGVVLSDVILTWNWADLKEAGLICDDLDPIPVFFLADLYVVLEMLERSSDKVHYFNQRTWLERKVSYMGDELDLLAFYFNNGLCLDIEHKPPGMDSVEIFAVGASKDFEPYFMAPFSHSTAKKRSPKLGWFADLVDKVENLAHPGWLQSALTLLNVPRTQYDLISHQVRERRNAVQKLPTPASASLVFENDLLQFEELLVVIIFKGLNSDMVKAAADEACGKAFNQSSAHTAVVIAFDSKHHKFAENSSVSIAHRADFTK